MSRCVTFNLALDKSTDVSDTAQLVVFIRGVMDNFEIIKEFLVVASMSLTTTCQNISNEMIRLMEVSAEFFKIVWIHNWWGSINDWQNEWFTKRFLDALASHDVVNHCIINQVNLCVKGTGLLWSYEKSNMWIILIHRGLNQHHFKALLEEIDTDCPSVVCISL